jgi:hypothetical protein
MKKALLIFVSFVISFSLFNSLTVLLEWEKTRKPVGLNFIIQSYKTIFSFNNEGLMEQLFTIGTCFVTLIFYCLSTYVVYDLIVYKRKHADIPQ